METQLLRFITTLRKNDLAVSTAETLDAMAVAGVIGYSDRLMLKAALGSALAKTVDDRQLFETVFDQFFMAPVSANELADNEIENVSEAEAEGAEQENQNELDSAEGAESEEGGAGPASDSMAEAAAALETELADLIASGNSDSVSLAVQDAAEAVDLQNMQFSTQKGLFGRRMMEQLGLEEFQQAVSALQALDDEEANQLAQWLEQGRRRIDMLVRDAVERQLVLNANAAGRELQEHALRNTRLSALEHYHMQKMPELIRKLAKKLASRHKRRSKVAKRGKLDVGKTLRKNMAYGGVPFHLYWKRIERQKPELIVLCDVSGSVSTYARFLLLFLYGLNDVLPNIKSFVFCSSMNEVTDIFDKEPADKAMEIVNQRYAQGGSDYGGALQDFADQQMSRINGNTTVLILGDGRTGGGYSGLPVLRQIYDRANLVLWFNPEPKSMWNTGDSAIERYQTATHFVAECNSLAKLERLLDKLLTLLN